MKLPELTKRRLETQVTIKPITLNLVNVTKQLDPKKSSGFHLIISKMLKELHELLKAILKLG